MIEKAPKTNQNFPSWFRPLAFVVVETFLWTTLYFDLALAFESHAKNLRPKQATQSSLGEQLQFDLTGGKSNVSVAQDGSGKPFRGKFPSLSFLSKHLSGSEFDVIRMALSPSKGLGIPSESEIAAFFTYVKAIGFDELIQIQDVTKRIESLTVNATRKGLLLTSVSSLKGKITPLLGHVGTPIGIGLPDILASGTEDLDGTLRSNFSNAFAKAVEARGSPQAKLTLIKSYVAPLPHASKLRLLHLLRLIGELKRPEEKERAIVSFVGRYGFSIENAIQLSKIFNGKANLEISTKDTIQMFFLSGVGMKAPDEVVEILVDALENSQIDSYSVSFEIGHWAAALLGKRTRLSDEEKSELVALLSKHPHWFKQFAEEAVNRGTVERIMLGNKPDIGNIPEAAKTLLYDFRKKELATEVQIHSVAKLIEHYGVTPADLKAVVGIDGKMRDLGALVIAKGMKMEFLENNFREVARRVHVRENLTDPRATLILFGALYPRSTNNVHLALSALTSHYPDLFYRQMGSYSQLIHPEDSDHLIQKIVEDLRGKPLRRDEVEGLIDGIFQDVRFRRRFSKEYATDPKVMKPLKDKVERLVALLRESSFEEGKIEEAVNAVFETSWLRNLSLQSFERFKVKNGKQLTDNAAAHLTNKLFIDLRSRVITDLKRKVFYDLYKEIRDIPIRELKVDAIAEIVLDSMNSRLQESGVKQAITSELINPILDNVTRYLSQRPLREDQIALLRRVLQFALEVETKRQADLTSRDGGAKVLEGIEFERFPTGLLENFVDVQRLPNGYERRVIDLTQMAGLKEKISALENLFDLKMQSGDEYALLVKDGKVFAIALENREQGLFRPVSLPGSEGPAYTKEELGALAQGYQQAIAKAEVLETEQMERPTTDFGWARHFAYKYHLKAALSLLIIMGGFLVPAFTAAATPVATSGVPAPIADLTGLPLQSDSGQPILSYGSDGEGVLQSQEMLSRAIDGDELPGLLKTTDVDLTNLKANWKLDGKYGWRTEAMVYAFQKKYNLTADGDVGPETWKKLQEVMKSAPSKETSPKPRPPLDDKEAMYAQAGISDVSPPSVTPLPQPEITLPDTAKVNLPSKAMITLSDQMEMLGAKVPVSAVFWDPEAIQNPKTFFAKARANGVTEIFLYADNLVEGKRGFDTARMVKVVQEARAQGIQKVRLLTGDPSWAYEPDDAHVKFDSLLAKVKELEAKGAKVEGLAIDVEPYLVREKWNNDLSGYVHLRNALQEKAVKAGLDLVAFEPYWFGMDLLETGEKLAGYTPYSGVTAIMSYGDHAMGVGGIHHLSKWLAPKGNHLLGVDLSVPKNGVSEGETFFGEEWRLPEELSRVIARSQEQHPSFRGVFLHFENAQNAEKAFDLLDKTPKPKEVKPTPYLLGEYDYGKNVFTAHPRPIGIDPSFETELKPFTQKKLRAQVLDFIGEVWKDLTADLRGYLSKIFRPNTSLETVKKWKGDLFGKALPDSLAKGVVLWDPQVIPRERVGQYLEGEAKNGTNIIYYGTAKLLTEPDPGLRETYRENAFLFIEEAKKRGIKVYSLQGDHLWILYPSKAVTYFHALESIALQGRTLDFANHVFNLDLGVSLSPKTQKERDYNEKVVKAYPNAVAEIGRAVGERFMSFVDPTYAAIESYRQTDSFHQMIMAYELTPEAILNTVQKIHVAGRPYTVAIEADHSLSGKKGFHRREDDIRPTLETVYQRLKGDPDFKGFTVHFAGTKDRQEVLEKGHLSSWNTVHEGVDWLFAKGKKPVITVWNYLVGEVKPKRVEIWEEIPPTTRNIIMLRIQALIGGLFGLDMSKLSPPLGAEPGSLFFIGKSLWGLQYETRTQITDVSVTIVDKNRNPIGEEYDYRSLINGEEALFVPGSGYYAEFKVRLEKWGNRWKSFAGNIIIDMGHRSEILPNGIYSKGINIKNGEKTISVLVPLNKWGIYQPKILLVTETKTQTEQIVDEVGGPDLEASLEWAKAHREVFLRFVKEGKGALIRENILLESEYETLSRTAPEALLQYMERLSVPRLEEMIIAKRDRLKPIDRATLAFLRIRELPTLKVGIDRFDPEVSVGPTYHPAGESVYLPLHLENEGSRPVAHYTAQLFFRNVSAGIDLPLTGGKKTLPLNGVPYTGWVEGNRVILEPFSGKFEKPVILGGDWVRTDGIPQENVAFSRSGFQVEAFRTELQGTRLILEKTHDIVTVNGEERYVKNRQLKGPVKVFDERFLKLPVALKQNETVQGLVHLGKLPTGSYSVNGDMSSEDGTFTKRFYTQFQVGMPKLELSPVRTTSDLFAHPSAKPFIETEVKNTGETSVAVYASAVFTDKRTGEEISTERPNDPYEAHFVLPNGKTADVITLGPGQKISVRVRLVLPPDPLTEQKNGLLELRREAKELLALSDLDEVKEKAGGVVQQAVHVAEKALDSRKQDLSEQRRRADTEEEKGVVRDLEKGIQGISREVEALKRLGVRNAASVEEVVSLTTEAFGRLAATLNESSNGIYGVRLHLVDVNAGRGQEVYLGDRGVMARTDTVLFEVYTGGAVQRKVEDYVTLLDQIRGAKLALIELEIARERQAVGIVDERKGIEKASQAEWVMPIRQSVNLVDSTYFGEAFVQETDRLLEEALRQELGEDIWKMRGEFERKDWPHFLRPFRELVKPFKGLTSYKKIEGTQIRQLSNPSEFKKLQDRAISKVRSPLEAEGKTEHLAYLNRIVFHRDLVDLDKLSDPDEFETLLQKLGGIPVLSEKFVQILNDYLEGKGITSRIEGTDPQTILATLQTIQSQFPEDPVLKKAATSFLAQQDRIGTLRKRLLEAEANAVRLENTDIPEAKTHVANLTGEDLARAERAMLYALQTVPAEERAAYITRIKEAHALVLGHLKGKVGELEAKLSEQEAEARELKASLSQWPGLSKEAVEQKAFLSLREFQIKSQVKIQGYVERGKQLQKAGELFEAKAFFEKAIALITYHHSHAYLKEQFEKSEELFNAGRTQDAELLLEQILGEAISLNPDNYPVLRDRARKALQAVLGTEKRLDEAAKRWVKIDEKLKKAERVTATKETITQFDRFLYGAFRLLEGVREEQVKKKNEGNIEFLNRLLSDLSLLRGELNQMQEGEDLSSLLLKAEARLDEADKTLNKFSIRVASFNVAFSFIRYSLNGVIGPLSAFSVSLPDPKAGPKEVVRELVASMDLFRMVTASRSHQKAEEEALKAFAKKNTETLLSGRSPVVEGRVRLAEIDKETRGIEGALKLAGRHLESETAEGEILSQKVQDLEEKTTSLPPRVLTAKEKTQEDITALKDAIKQAKQGHQALLRSEERAGKGTEALKQTLDQRASDIGTLERDIQKTLKSAGPNMVSLYQMILGRLQTYEQKEKAEDLTKQGRITTSGILFHPKRFWKLFKVWENPIGVVDVGLIAYVGNKVAVLPIVEHELLSNLSGTHSIRFFDDAFGAGVGPLEFTRKLESDADYHRFGLSITYKPGSEDKTVKAFEYLTDQEAAFILAMVVGPERADEVVTSIKHTISQETELALAQSAIEEGKQEQAKLEQFLKDLSTKIDHSKARIDDLKGKLRTLQAHYQALTAPMGEEAVLGSFTKAESVTVPEEKEAPVDKTKLVKKEPPPGVRWGDRIVAAMIFAYIVNMGRITARRIGNWLRGRKAKKETTPKNLLAQLTEEEKSLISEVIDSWIGEGHDLPGVPSGIQKLIQEEMSHRKDPKAEGPEIVPPVASDGGKKEAPQKATPGTLLEFLDRRYLEAIVSVKKNAIQEGYTLKDIEKELFPRISSELVKAGLDISGLAQAMTLHKVKTQIVTPFFADRKVRGAETVSQWQDVMALQEKFGAGFILPSEEFADTVSLVKAVPKHLVGNEGQGTPEGTQKPRLVDEADERAKAFVREKTGKDPERMMADGELPKKEFEKIKDLMIFNIAIERADLLFAVDEGAYAYGSVNQEAEKLRKDERRMVSLGGIIIEPPWSRRLWFKGEGIVKRLFWGPLKINPFEGSKKGLIPRLIYWPLRLLIFRPAETGMMYFLQSIQYLGSASIRTIRSVFEGTKPTHWVQYLGTLLVKTVESLFKGDFKNHIRMATEEFRKKKDTTATHPVVSFGTLSNPELSLKNFVVGVEGRWLVGHVYVIQPEYTGGIPYLRTWYETLESYVLRQGYLSDREQVEKLLQSGSLSDAAAAYFKSYQGPLGPNLHYGLGDLDIVTSFERDPKEPNMRLEDKEAIGKDAERLDEGIITSRMLYPNLWVIIPDGTPAGQKFQLRMKYDTPKGSWMGGFLELLQGRIRFEPTLVEKKDKDGKTIYTLEKQIKSLQDEHFKEVKVAKQVTAEKREETGRIASKEMEELGKHEVVIGKKGEEIQVDLGTATGYEPGRVTLFFSDSFLGRFFGRIKTFFFKATPISFYSEATPQDTIVAAALKARYDPKEVEKKAKERIDADRKFSEGHDIDRFISEISGKLKIGDKTYTINNDDEKKDYAGAIQHLLWTQGVILPDVAMYDTEALKLLKSPLADLPKYLKKVHEIVLTPQLSGLEDARLREGLLILKTKETLLALSEALQGAAPHTGFEAVARSFGVRDDQVKVAYAEDATHEKTVSYQERTLYHLALLRHYEGEARAVGNKVAGYTYHGSHDPGIFKAGDYTFGWVKDFDPWKLVQRTEDPQGYGRTRSWASVSEKAVQHGASPMGSEILEPVFKEIPDTEQRILLEAVRLGNKDGREISHLIPMDKALVVVAKFVSKFGGGNPGGGIFKEHQGKVDVIKDLLKRAGGEGRYPNLIVLTSEQFRFTRELVSGQRGRVIGEIELLLPQLDQAATAKSRAILENPKFLGRALGIAATFNLFTKEQKEEIERLMNKGIKVHEARLSELIKAVTTLENLSGVPLYKKLSVLNDEEREEVENLVRPSFEEAFSLLKVNAYMVPVFGMLQFKEKFQESVHKGLFIEKISPLEGYLVSKGRGDKDSEQHIHDYYVKNSNIQPSLDDVTAFMSDESREVVRKLKENVRKARDDPALMERLIREENERREKKRKALGVGKEEIPDITEKKILDVLKLSKHLEDTGELVLGNPIGKMIDRVLLWGLKLSAATWVAGIVANLGIPGVPVPALFNATLSILFIRILERAIVHFIKPYSQDAQILARFHGVTTKQFSGLWDSASWWFMFGIAIFLGASKGRIPLWKRYGTVLDANPVPLLSALLVLNEPPHTAPLSGFNLLPTDAYNIGKNFAEDTGAGIGRTKPTWQPTTPAQSLAKLLFWRFGHDMDMYNQSVKRAAQRAKGKGLESALKEMFENPLYKEEVEDYRTFFDTVWGMKAFEHDQVDFAGSRGAGFLSYVFTGFTASRLFAKRIGPFAPGVVEAYWVNKELETLDEPDKLGGNFEKVEKLLQLKQGDTHGLRSSDYQLTASLAKAYKERPDLGNLDQELEAVRRQVVTVDLVQKEDATVPDDRFKDGIARDGGWKKEDAKAYVRGWEALSPEVKQQLLHELNEVLRVDVDEWRGRLNVIQETPGKRAPPSDGYEFPEAVQITSPLLSRGKSEIHKMALLLPAGGAGSRLINALKADTPEGAKLRAEYNIQSIAEVDQFTKPTWKVTKIMKKSSLQLTLETVARLDPEMPVVIGLSPYTKEQIRQFLKEHDNFGLKHIGLVEDDLGPIVDLEKKIVVTEEGHVYTGGMGGAGSLRALEKKIEVQGERQNISTFDWIRSFDRENLFIFNADNPGLPEKVLLGIAGAMDDTDADVIGLGYDYPIGKPYGLYTKEVVGNEKRTVVVEAFERGKELDLAMEYALQEKVPLYANAGAYALTLEAAKTLTTNFSAFPWHTPERSLDVSDPTGKPLKGYRFEKFNPDILEVLERLTEGSANIQIFKVRQEDLLSFKDLPSAYLAADNIEKRDRERLLALAPDIQFGESSVVEVSPLFDGKIGKGVLIAPKAKIYFGKGPIEIDDGVILSGEQILEGPIRLTAKDGGYKGDLQKSVAVKEIENSNPTFEDLMKATAPSTDNTLDTMAEKIHQQTGIGAKLFIEKVRLLDPRTRNLIGKISDQLTLPDSIRKVIQDNSVTVDELLKFYEVLARYFEGVEAKEIKLPEGLTFDAEGLRTAIDLGIIQNSHERQNFSLGEVMGLLFTPAQRQQLDDLKHQALEMETIEKGV